MSAYVTPLSNARPARTLALALAAGFLVGCAAPRVSAPVAAEAGLNYEGLASVYSRALAIAQVRPGVDFSAYSGVMLRAPELAFRTPDRAVREFPLSPAQKDRFRDVLAEAFAQEFRKLASLELVDEPGPDVLALRIRVQDITVTVQPRALGGAGRAAALLEASGDATVVLELSDSQSNEILARGVDTQTVTGVAARQQGEGMRTNFEDAAEVSAKWASIARAGLDDLTAGR